MLLFNVWDFAAVGNSFVGLVPEDTKGQQSVREGKKLAVLLRGVLPSRVLC